MEIDGGTLEFEKSREGYWIILNGKEEFYLSVYVGPTGMSHLSPNILRRIADKWGECQIHGLNPPICNICKGTPLFPKEIDHPIVGKMTCQEEIHPMFT